MPTRTIVVTRDYNSMLRILRHEGIEDRKTITWVSGYQNVDRIRGIDPETLVLLHDRFDQVRVLDALKLRFANIKSVSA